MLTVKSLKHLKIIYKTIRKDHIYRSKDLFLNQVSHYRSNMSRRITHNFDVCSVWNIPCTIYQILGDVYFVFQFRKSLCSGFHLPRIIVTKQKYSMEMPFLEMLWAKIQRFPASKGRDKWNWQCTHAAKGFRDKWDWHCFPRCQKYSW